MHRILRVTLAALALLLVVVGSALARPGTSPDPGGVPPAASVQPSIGAGQDEPDREEADAAPSAALLARLVGRLAEVGVETDADALAALAAEYGVGGAVRILWFADAAGKEPAEVAAMFDAGQGWGTIAATLDPADGSGALHPGIGHIIGKHGADAGPGAGHASVPGQARKQR